MEKGIRDCKRHRVKSWYLLIHPSAHAQNFGEIRGQATADYQNYLDQQWIAELRAKYPVNINQEVLKNVR